MPTFRLTAGVVAVLLLAGPGGRGPRVVAGAGCDPIRSTDQLVRMSRAELEALYRSAAPGPGPQGFAPARAIFSPGSRLTVPTSRVVRVLWKGKEFPGDGTMVNRLPLGVRAVRASVFPGPSWLDGGPSWVFDYCGTSKLFGHVRDEVREVAPGVYLGLTYLRKPAGPELAVFFALDAR